MPGLRAAVVILGVSAAIVLYGAGLVFGLNGDQYDWFEGGAVTGGFVVLAATIWTAWRVRMQPRSFTWSLFLGGLVLMIGAPMLTGARYSDPYDGSLFWPHLLAVVAFCGLLLAVGALIRALSR